MERSGIGIGASSRHYDFHSNARSVMTERFVLNLKHGWVGSKTEYTSSRQGLFCPETLPMKKQLW
jgi:hypothetical protein